MNKTLEYPKRARFREILSEFLPPYKPSRKVIVLLGGMPGYPRRAELMHQLAKKGYWVFNPRYRGSWESGGELFKKPVENDVSDIITGIFKGFKDLWTGKRFKLNPSKIILWGSSFGGAVSLLASRDSRVDKVIALAPLVDWLEDSEDEPMDKFIPYLKEAFGNGYRISSGGWEKILSGKFMNPAASARLIDGKKILIIHARDDKVCPYSATLEFCEKTNTKLISLASGGHMLSYDDPKIKRAINKFLAK